MTSAGRDRSGPSRIFCCGQLPGQELVGLSGPQPEFLDGLVGKELHKTPLP